VRHSDHSDPALRHRTAPVPRPEAARALVLAALNDLVEAGLASWHQRGPGRLELHCTSGEAWLLDSSGVTRLR
jgi:hypothetical protein